MAAPSNATYLLQSMDTADLPGSRVLIGSSSYGIALQDGGPGDNLTIITTGQLSSLATLNVSGLYILNSDTNTFIARGLNTDGTISITNANFVAGNPVLGVVANSHTQKINVEQGGILKSTQSTINLIEGSGINIDVTNNSGSNRADITISFDGSSGGVTSVGLTSSTGLTITGSPITTSGVFTVDLPDNGNDGQVLTVTGTGPQTIAWQDNTSSASGWSHFPALQNVVMANFGLKGIGTGNVGWSTTEGVSPYIFATGVDADTNRYLAAKVGTSGDDVTSYIVLTDGVPGTDYAEQGVMLYGNQDGSTGNFLYSQLAPPTDPDQYELRFNFADQVPFWYNLDTHTGQVALGNTTIGLFPLGDSSAFVTDPNITPDSVIMVSPFGEYQNTMGGNQTLSKTPASQATIVLNATDGATDGLPIGFAIFGDQSGGVDNGKYVQYYIVGY